LPPGVELAPGASEIGTGDPNLVGISRREAVARELKSLERDGLLTRRRGAMVITNVIELNERVEEGFDGTE